MVCYINKCAVYSAYCIQDIYEKTIDNILNGMYNLSKNLRSCRPPLATADVKLKKEKNYA